VRALGELPPALLAAELGSASIYCLPARYEPFGLSVLEAALAGCALVLGDIASLRETWGEAAVYVAPEDHAGLRGALQRLVARPQERERLARAARARAQRLTHHAMAQACLSAYAGLSPAFAGLAAASTEEPACASSCSSIRS
jgi:glycosyltransferase involved in cell wall biosynthesis